MTEKQPMFQPLMVELLLVHPMPIVICAVAGGTQTKKIGRGIADIMVLVCCV
jgi:hypothetical protein